MQQTYKITINGQVQGVGFRPYVYTLANTFGLLGTVSNNQEGVLIYVRGAESDCIAFYKELLDHPPPVSRIQQSDLIKIDNLEFDTFQIVPSSKDGAVNLSLTPDFAICQTCAKELNDTTNRRFGYAFTTCVHCGPRWSITERFPFERQHTSIDTFKMCEACENEYTDPENRRFHSQTNSCCTCGIQLELLDATGKNTGTQTADLFKETAFLLKTGKIVAVKNTSGFLLCCNAEDETAINTLRKRKNRPNKPFAVLYPDMSSLKEALQLTPETEDSLNSSERPICIVNCHNINGNIALSEIAPGLNQLGVMLPHSGVLQMLANELDFPIVATSGNIHGSPILSTNEEAVQKIGSVTDYFLVHNLHIERPQDDSVQKFSYKYSQEVLFRRARGFAPNFFDAKINTDEKILAMGAHLKSTVAFYPNDYLYISEYLGHLDNFDVYQRFTSVVDSFIKLFEQKPTVVLADAHPMYESTKYAREFVSKNNVNCIEIQHHKAHFAAILGNHHLFDEKVLGVIFDGTGLGDDGAIWGGEFFEYDNRKMKRIAHVDYFDWLLADKMAREPRLSLLSVSGEKLNEVLSRKFIDYELKSFRSIKKENTLKTSSVGRLFDAVASLLNLTDFNNYEGEAAMLLENQVEYYDLNLCKSYIANPQSGINATEILDNMYVDLQNDTPVNHCVQNFIFTLANAIITKAEMNGFTKIACSGGVFQNTLLVDMLLEMAEEKMTLYFHKDISPNDENIAFGQIMYYLNCMS